MHFTLFIIVRQRQLLMLPDLLPPLAALSTALPTAFGMNEATCGEGAAVPTMSIRIRILLILIVRECAQVCVCE